LYKNPRLKIKLNLAPFLNGFLSGLIKFPAQINPLNSKIRYTHLKTKYNGLGNQTDFYQG